MHELGHATGATQRLNRDLSGKFGSESYAKEELRAELYSFLQALELGIDYDLKNHASYVDSWLKVLKDDRSEISKAIKDCVKMVSFVKEEWYPKELNKEQNKESTLKLAPTKEQEIAKTQDFSKEAQGMQR